MPVVIESYGKEIDYDFIKINLRLKAWLISKFKSREIAINIADLDDFSTSN